MSETLDPSSSASPRVASIVLAGGKGSRLSPLTEARCKPAVSFAGKYRLIDVPLSNSINSGINEIYVLSQYLPKELHDHIRSFYDTTYFEKGGISLIQPGDGVVFDGTADAVRKNLKLFKELPVDYFVILSGDQLYQMDLKKFVDFAASQDADLAVATKPVDAYEATRMGLMKIDPTCAITDFTEKPQEPALLKEFEMPQELLIQETGEPRYLASMGIYVFKKEALIDLLEGKGVDFGMHLIPEQVSRGKTSAFLYEGYWEDIGTVGAYYTANLSLIKYRSRLNMYDDRNPIFSLPRHLPSPIIENTYIKSSLISQGSLVEAKEVTGSIVGVRSHIKEGTIIRDSILIGNHGDYQGSEKSHPFTIGKNCFIEGAIIDEGVIIGDGVRLVNDLGLKEYESDSVIIRDGIIIIPKGATIPSNFSLDLEAA